MSLKSNFKQAINELSGSNPKAEEDNVRKETTQAAVQTSAVNKKPDPQAAAPIRASVSSGSPAQSGHSQTAVPAPEKTETNDNANREKESAVITPDTQIHGAIVTKSPLIIKGKVKGNILCEETVSLTGEIEGNVTAMSIEIRGASIKGDLRMKNSAMLEDNAVLNGNLEADSAVINGSVEGDMRVHSNINIMQNSKINGDIYAGSLEIAKGAVINGKVAVTPEGEQLPKNSENKNTASQNTGKTSQPTAQETKPAATAAANAQRPADATRRTSDTSSSAPARPNTPPQAKPADKDKEKA